VLKLISLLTILSIYSISVFCRFYASATDVVQATQHQARDTFLALSNLATSIASYTMEQSKMMNAGGRSWPFITIPNFEISGSQNSAISQALQLSIVPLVSRAIKSEWEVYSVVKQSWIQHGIDVSSSTAEAVDVPPITNYVHLGSWIESSSSDSNSSSSSVHASSSSTTPAAMPQTGPGVPLGPAKLGLGYAPIWQQSQAPLDPAIINFDIFSHPLFDQAYQVMYASALPVLSELVDLEFLSSAGSHTAPSINPVAHHDPRFFVMQPLYPTTSMPNNKHDVVGFVVAVLEWNVLLANMLPAAGGGAAPEDVEDGPIIAVVKSSKGEAGNNVFSYSIQGPKATFLGLGDFHDSAYDHLSMHTNFAVLEPSSATTNTTNSTGNGAVQRVLQTTTESSDGGTSNSSSCEYEIWLYPTQEMQQEYATRTPAAFATVVLFIFFLVACVFVLYDYTVQRRQNRVMAKAKRTNALVSTFFPSTVRDRILGDTLLADDKPIDKAELKKGSEHVNGNGGGGGEGKRKGKGRRKKRTGSGGAKASKNAGSLKTFLTEGGPKSEDLGTEDGVNAQGFNLNPYDTKPIADLFPHTTIMFADIVGFTAWSSVREPTQVFILLETLYHAFDQIANRRRVFKVETVGDCYGT
jgi:Adenylate and Guanylate cyclase catalytic domain